MTLFGLAAGAGSSRFRSTRNRIAMTYLMAGKLRLDLPTRNSEEPKWMMPLSAGGVVPFMNAVGGSLYSCQKQQI